MGYTWYKDAEDAFKGYLIDKDGNIYEEQDAIHLLRSIEDIDALKYFLEESKGFFSAVIHKKGKLIAIVDIGRTMPLFYDVGGKTISDDPTSIRNILRVSPEEVNGLRSFEMYATEYVCYENTIYNDIKQVMPGCILLICDDGIETIPYFVHKAKQVDITEEEAIKQLDRKTETMVSQLKKIVGNRSLVLSLSGGYDSRYVAFSLKRNGIDNVILYTYGKPDSFEVQQAKRIADATGYEWINIEYKDEDTASIVDDKDFFAYMDSADYTAYLQNYVALKKIKEQKLVREDSVFITGLCNDMPTGFYVPSSDEVEKYGQNEEGIINYILEHRFIKFEVTEEGKNLLSKDIRHIMKLYEIGVKDYDSFISGLDCIETLGAHIKCYLNMNRVHEFFGYRWTLPCWDKDLLIFWYSLPTRYRLHQKLYEKYVTEELGEVYGVCDKKHLNILSGSPIRQKIIREVGGLYAKAMYALEKPIRRKTDVNNFAPLEAEFYKRIKTKKAIKMSRASVVLLNSIFVMDLRYGANWYEKARKYRK